MPDYLATSVVSGILRWKQLLDKKSYNCLHLEIPLKMLQPFMIIVHFAQERGYSRVRRQGCHQRSCLHGELSGTEFSSPPASLHTQESTSSASKTVAE